MGRYREGAKLHDQWMRIDIYLLLNFKYFKKGKRRSGIIALKDGAKIGYTCSLKEEEKYLELEYIVTTRQGEKHDLKYRIGITVKPSNLGKGELYYFLCPLTGRKCRVLYMAYNSLHFYSRYAYKKPIYYPSQLDGKKMRTLTMYYHLRDQIEKIESQKNFHKYHLGEPTKAYKRLVRLKERKDYALNQAKIHLLKYLYLF